MKEKESCACTPYNSSKLSKSSDSLSIPDTLKTGSINVHSVTPNMLDQQLSVIGDEYKIHESSTVSNTATVYDNWQRFIEDQVGFVLPDRQKHWLRHAIDRIATQYQTTAIELLHRVHDDALVMQSVIDAVLIPQSLFFRHQPSFKFIAQDAEHWCLENKSKLTSYPSGQSTGDIDGIYSNLCLTMTETTGSNKISSNKNKISSNKIKSTEYRVWSVGCSFGQETWSLAMLLMSLDIPYHVWGSDVSETALTHAKLGNYRCSQLSRVPENYWPMLNIQDTDWQVGEALKKYTTFFKYNLFIRQSLDLPLMNVIMCQNVLIYFRKFDQRDILNFLVSQLQVNGVLILAPGEAVHWENPVMQRVVHSKVNAWQKVSISHD